MPYKERIAELMAQVPATLVDMSAERKAARMPTQASSNFLTNREQGDWAEQLLLKAINEIAQHHVAVSYGMGDDRVAGEPGFTEFYTDFQQELADIGKRPDLLIFRRTDLPVEWGNDISCRSRAELDELVPKARMGLEVRSSAFLSRRYEALARAQRQGAIRQILDLKQQIQVEYSDLLLTSSWQACATALDRLDEQTVREIDFKCPPRRGSSRRIEAAALMNELKSKLKTLRKRDHLSVTPKVEDLRVVYQWVQTYGVPHYYAQVFFDQVYVLSYEKILILLTEPQNKNVHYFVEGDVKNQQKRTIKINLTKGEVLVPDVEEPTHASCRQEIGGGRLRFYVTFNQGAARLNTDTLAALLGVAPADL